MLSPMRVRFYRLGAFLLAIVVDSCPQIEVTWTEMNGKEDELLLASTRGDAICKFHNHQTTV